MSCTTFCKDEFRQRAVFDAFCFDGEEWSGEQWSLLVEKILLDLVSHGHQCFGIRFLMVGILEL